MTIVCYPTDTSKKYFSGNEDWKCFHHGDLHSKNKASHKNNSHKWETFNLFKNLLHEQFYVLCLKKNSIFWLTCKKTQLTLRKVEICSWISTNDSSGLVDGLKYESQELADLFYLGSTYLGSLIFFQLWRPLKLSVEKTCLSHIFKAQC